MGQSPQVEPPTQIDNFDSSQRRHMRGLLAHQHQEEEWPPWLYYREGSFGEKAISIWALMHGMVGILRKTLVVEEGHGDIGDGIVIAKRIKDDLESFLAKTVDNILSNWIISKKY